MTRLFLTVKRYYLGKIDTSTLHFCNISIRGHLIRDVGTSSPRKPPLESVRSVMLTANRT